MKTEKGMVKLIINIPYSLKRKLKDTAFYQETTITNIVLDLLKKKFEGENGEDEKKEKDEITPEMFCPA